MQCVNLIIKLNLIPGIQPCTEILMSDNTELLMSEALLNLEQDSTKWVAPTKPWQSNPKSWTEQDKAGYWR